MRDDTPGLTGLGPPYYRRPTDERPHEDPHIPTGMRLHEWIAEEGYFREQGLEPEVLWDDNLALSLARAEEPR